MKHTLAILAALCALSAHATDNKPLAINAAAAINSTRVGIVNSSTLAFNPSVGPTTALGGSLNLAGAQMGGQGGLGGSVSQSGNASISTPRQVATAIASAPPPAAVTCASSGFGTAFQTPGLGVSLSGGTGTELGCDVARDLSMMQSVGMPIDDQRRRVCAKPEIAKAAAICKLLAEQDRVSAVLESTPVRPVAAVRAQGDI